MPNSNVPKPTIFRGSAAVYLAGIGLTLLSATAYPVFGQDDSKERSGEIPDRFFQVQDSNGYFWQAVNTGALTSGETQYLQSGLNLLVDEQGFAPSNAQVKLPTESTTGELNNGIITLGETREGLAIERELLFDRERGAVRVLDRFRNLSGGTTELNVALRTTYPFAWQTLHGADGKLLSSDPVLKLAEDETGVVIRFGAAEGRPDTLILFGDGAALKPGVNGSTNRREITLNYQPSIPAGGTVSLLHWIAMRALPAPDRAGNVFSEFRQGGKLIRSGVEPADESNVANFRAASFPERTTASAKLRSLVALNELLDRAGLSRRGVDLLWLGPTSQIEGSLDPSASIMVRTAVAGERKVAGAAIAAIRGGAGTGRAPSVFLRDGQVYSGPMETENLRLLVEGGDPIELVPSELPLFLSKVGAEDGLPPNNTVGFVETLDRTVLALAELEEGLPVFTASGKEIVSLADLVETGTIVRPMAGHRLIKADGSTYPAFLSADRITVSAAGDEAIEIPGESWLRYWAAGRETLRIESGDERWLAFDEIPLSPLPDQAFLLAGNSVRTGQFASPSLAFRSNGVEVILDPTRIAAITRVGMSDGSNKSHFPTVPPTLRIELKSGESIEGIPVAATFQLMSSGADRTVPWSDFLAYLSADVD